jgi:BirA family transcriptional regulator, biotin operon repressor / biotin---[acetyl-CoA-carboxylase] ligase
MNSRLIVLQETESTQDVARELALSGEPEGVAVMALRQNRGRGRAGHSWVSPEGKNLALSLILRPHATPQQAPLLGLMAGVAVAETLQERRVKSPQLKWPNDVLVSGRKIAGIISEGTIIQNSVVLVIIGVGLNVNVKRTDFPVDLRDSITSVLLATGRQWPLEEAATSLLAHLGSLYHRMNTQGYGLIVPLWDARWAHRGHVLTRGELQGIAEGIDSDGALLMKTRDNRVHRVSSGEVAPLNSRFPG